MHLKNYVLSRDESYILIDDLDIICGVTTKIFGDTRSKNENFNDMILEIKSITDSRTALSLAPTHGTSIRTSINTAKDEVFKSDGLVHGSKQNGIIAMAHASWITLSKNITSDVFRLMRNCFLDSADINVLIYPGISKPYYEVKSDVYDKLAVPGMELAFTKNGNASWHLDLKHYIVLSLLRLGVPEKNISIINTCSASTRLKGSGKYMFYSYRKRKDMERNVVFAKYPDSETVTTCSTGDCPCVIYYFKKP